jgi:hypothetical protein
MGDRKMGDCDAHWHTPTPKPEDRKWPSWDFRRSLQLRLVPCKQLHFEPFDFVEGLAGNSL